MADLLLPVLGDVMTEGRLVSWLQPDGAEVEAGQPLYELESEKVNATIEAPAAGVLRQLVPEGLVVPVGTLVGRVVAPGEEPLEPAAKADGPDHAQAPAATGAPPRPARAAATVLATPAAKRLARELGLDIAALSRGRRIREADVLAFHAAHAEPAPAPEPEPATAAVESPRDGQAAGTDYAGRRRAVGENMRQSLATSAQLTLTTEVGVDAALEMVDGLNQEWNSEGVAATLTRLVVKACALALRDHPALNARLEGDRIVRLPVIDIGIAMDLEVGLVVPVVRRVDALPLKELCRVGRELTLKGREGSFPLADTEGGTFTVTSLASTVVDAFTPIINPPQAAILGVGRVREVAAFEGEAVVRRRVTTLSLTFDHRLNDGAPAARFLGRVVELLDRPYLLM